jgi:anti-sigma B factor antagonist
VEAETVGDVTVVRLTCRNLVAEADVRAVGRQLRAPVEDGCRKLVLDLGATEWFDSAAIGQLVSLRRRVAASGGRLALCGAPPWLHGYLGILRLDQLFEVYRDRAEALRAMASSADEGEMAL